MRYIDLNNISSDDENEDENEEEYADMPPLISASDDEKTLDSASDEASKLEWRAVCLSFMLLLTAFVLPFLVGVQMRMVEDL